MIKKRMEILSKFPPSLTEKLKDTKLDKSDLNNILIVYETLVRYKKLGVIDYREDSDRNMYYKPKDDINQQLKNINTQFELLRPFIKSDSELILKLENPNLILNRLMNQLHYSKEWKGEVLKILTGLTNLPKRSKEYRYELLKYTLKDSVILAVATKDKELIREAKSKIKEYTKLQKELEK